MKTIYIINVSATGCNGGIVHYISEAYTNIDDASRTLEKMHHLNHGDPNFMAYITGPVPLIEED